jgi:hypothetical protein
VLAAAAATAQLAGLAATTATAVKTASLLVVFPSI